MVVVLSGPPKAAPRVIDLTLLPPAGIDPRPVPPSFAAAEPARNSGTAVRQEPTALLPSQPVASPPDGTAPADLPDPAAEGTAPVSGLRIPATASPRQARVHPRQPRGVRRGIGGGVPAGDFAWIRDAIQHAIAYPSTARRMGWEGKVVVAFQLLSDGSVRTYGSCRARGTPPWTGERSTRPKRLPVPPLPAGGGDHHPRRLSADTALTLPTDLIVRNEDRLLGQVLSLAEANGYLRFVPGTPEAWRGTLRGLSGSLLQAFRSDPPPLAHRRRRGPRRRTLRVRRR